MTGRRRGRELGGGEQSALAARQTFAVLDETDTTERWDDVAEDDEEHHEAFDEALAGWQLI